jgi:hypothetical protein
VGGETDGYETIPPSSVLLSDVQDDARLPSVTHTSTFGMCEFLLKLFCALFIITHPARPFYTMFSDAIHASYACLVTHRMTKIAPLSCRIGCVFVIGAGLLKGAQMKVNQSIKSVCSLRATYNLMDRQCVPPSNAAISCHRKTLHDSLGQHS